MMSPYFHTSINYIDIDSLVIPKGLARKVSTFEDVTIGVDGNTVFSDSIRVWISASNVDCGGLGFNIDSENAKSLADAIYTILNSRKETES